MNLQSVWFLLPIILSVQLISTEDDLEQQFNVAANSLEAKLATHIPSGRKELKVYFEEVMSVAEVDTNLTIESIEGMRRSALVKLEELETSCKDISIEALVNLTASTYAILEDGLQDQVFRIWMLNEEAHENLTRYEDLVEEFRRNFRECTIEECKVDVLKEVLVKDGTIEEDIRKTVSDSGNLFGGLLWRFERDVLMPLMNEYSVKSATIVEGANNCPEITLEEK